MLGDTLSLATTTGPLGSVTKSVGNGLVPVIAMVESTTDKVGDATGLGAPLNGVLGQVGGAVKGLGGQVTSAG
ncbi:collagen-like triple helix repeat-containing protein, partial [Mesorhizobium japonicum]